MNQILKLLMLYIHVIDCLINDESSEIWVRVMVDILQLYTWGRSPQVSICCSWSPVRMTQEIGVGRNV